MSQCTIECPFALFDDGLHYCEVHNIPHLCDIAKCLDLEDGIYKCRFTHAQMRMISTATTGASMKTPTYHATHSFTIETALNSLSEDNRPLDKRFIAFVNKLYSVYISSNKGCSQSDILVAMAGWDLHRGGL